MKEGLADKMRMMKEKEAEPEEDEDMDADEKLLEMYHMMSPEDQEKAMRVMEALCYGQEDKAESDEE